jgi:nitric oxide reductase subunit B
MSGFFHTLEWIRLVADTLFIVAGVIPTVSAMFITYWYGSARVEEKRTDST